MCAILSGVLLGGWFSLCAASVALLTLRVVIGIGVFVWALCTTEFATLSKEEKQLGRVVPHDADDARTREADSSELA